jgi:hypothetical protein
MVMSLGDAVSTVTRIRAGQTRNQGSILGRGNIFRISKTSRWTAQATQPANGYRELVSRGKKGEVIKLITQLHQQPKLIITATIFPLPPYVIVECKGTNLHIYVCIANNLTSSLKEDIIMPSPYIPLNTEHTEMFPINLNELKKSLFLYQAGLSILALTAGFGKNDKFDLNSM